jgi:hypothetical protein
MLHSLLALAAALFDPSYWQALRAVDTRMATIAWRLQTGNAALCRTLSPATGLQLHAVDQYAGEAEADARRAFGFATPVQVQAVAPGSPSALAGVLPDDGLVAVNGEPVPAPARTDKAASVTRDAAQALIDRLPADAPLRLTVRRGGGERTVTLPATPGCRSAFEVLLGPGLKASSDGRIVQVGVRFFETLPDDKIAAVVAHELAHTILEHRRRLEAAGAQWGLLAEFGRNARLFRRTEDDADRLSVHLLRNAGYDPLAAVRFWREDGGKIDGGLFRGASHGSAKARAAAIAREIEQMGAADALPSVLATRDEPLTSAAPIPSPANAGVQSQKPARP